MPQLCTQPRATAPAGRSSSRQYRARCSSLVQGAPQGTAYGGNAAGLRSGAGGTRTLSSQARGPRRRPPNGLRNQVCAARPGDERSEAEREADMMAALDLCVEVGLIGGGGAGEGTAADSDAAENLDSEDIDGDDVGGLEALMRALAAAEQRTKDGQTADAARAAAGAASAGGARERAAAGDRVDSDAVASVLVAFEEASADEDGTEDDHDEDFSDEDGGLSGMDTSPRSGVYGMSEPVAAEVSRQRASGHNAQAAFEAVLERQAPEEITLEDASSVFPYPMDAFQADAVKVNMAGDSVVVCAPTGAGKTAIAVACAVPVLARGQRVVYTTPLKALSNQKLIELQEVFGEERVGLRTGDVSINPGAPIMVMTTEILRNISYRVLLQDGPADASQDLANVGLTVLDEVHYLGHPDRGSVWEEIVINCPPHISLLAMSATVANPTEIGAWIERVHGRCTTVQTSFRPVPLKWWFAWEGGEEDQGRGCRLEPLLEDTPRAVQMNSELGGTSREYDKRVAKLERLSQKMVVGGAWDDDVAREIEVLEGQLMRMEEADMQSMREPHFLSLVNTMADADLLPAIYFLFSRKRCNECATRVTAPLVTTHERTAILAELNVLRGVQPEAIPKPLVEPLLKGVASHHAGLLPAWKALVEALFQRGLIKVVFATETLAAGINMPARTTVISTLSRRRDTGYAALTHNELLQMAGRAGRRGFDVQGHCILAQTRFEGAREGVGIIAKGPENVESQFTVSYGMVLNLLSTRRLSDCKAFLDRSFLRFQATSGRDETHRQIKRLEARAAEISEELAEERQEQATKMLEAARLKVKVERKTLRTVRSQALLLRELEVEHVLGLEATSSPSAFQLALDAASADPPDAASAQPAAYAGSSDSSSSDSSVSYSCASDANPPDTSAAAVGRAADAAAGAAGRGPAAGASAAASSDPAGAAGMMYYEPLSESGSVSLPALVTLDLAANGCLHEALQTALCLGPAADIAKSVDYAALLDTTTDFNTYDLYCEEGLLACLGGDNRLYLVRPRHIAGVPSGLTTLTAFQDSLKLDFAAAAGFVHAAFQASVVNPWKETQLGVYASAGSVTSARVALSLAGMPAPAAGCILDGTGWPEAVATAAGALRRSRDEFRSVKKTIQRNSGSSRNRNRRLSEQALKMRQEVRRLRATLDGSARAADWDDFLNTVRVLEQFGATAPPSGTSTNALVRSIPTSAAASEQTPEPQDAPSSRVSGSLHGSSAARAGAASATRSAEGASRGEGVDTGVAAMVASGGRGTLQEGFMQLQTLGLIARDIRFENELWLALVLRSPNLEGVKPSALAGLVCALVTPFQVSRADALTTLDPSEELKLLLESTEGDATALAVAQAQRSVTAPIMIDLRYAGAVEAWVWAVEWEALREASSMDDGDIARLLSRIADLLRQIANASAVSQELRSTARVALKRVYRQPICDMLGG